MIDDATYAALKQNLLELTAAVAPQYDNYGDVFASRAYRAFEDSILNNLIDPGLRDVFVDLGCATGYQIFRVASQFKKLFGFDLSPDMIAHANRKLDSELGEKIVFQEFDLEKGIPLETHSVSFLSLNLGTASDIQNIGALLFEVQRVLRRAGRFLFSFYNRDALVYQWNAHPWPVSIAAEMDHALRCLNVHAADRIFSVYARAYTSAEIRSLMPNRLTIKEMVTYPAISSILPDDAFKDRQAASAILMLDKELSVSRYGAYHIVTGERSMFD